MYTVKSFFTNGTSSFAGESEVEGLAKMARTILDNKPTENYFLLRAELWRNDQAFPIQIYNAAGISERRPLCVNFGL